jgi:hypothetical protein
MMVNSMNTSVCAWVRDFGMWIFEILLVMFISLDTYELMDFRTNMKRV